MLAQALCWSAAWDMTRDAEMPASEYLTLVLSAVGVEQDSSVVRTLLRQALAAATVYSAPAKREASRRRLAEGLERLMRQAGPGSDSQLQLVRAFASAAVTGEQLATVRSLLDGSAGLGGLVVDTDLRWHLLHQLVRGGFAEDTEIDAELARDDTATGRRQAATALALRPRPEAKQEAWTSVVERDDLPNAIQRSIIGGFARAGQEELLRSFVQPYFAALTDVWATRTNETAQGIVLGLFPSLLADQPTLDAADAWLAGHEDAPPALRRLVLESRDDVARTLRAQARDAQA
jgi:aminopeptidase N